MAKRSATAFIDAFSGVRRRLSAVIAEGFAPFEIGGTQAKLLRYIGESAQISQADLARATFTDPAATGRALKTLLDRGWVQRKRSRDDRRAFSLELTAKGQELLAHVHEVREAIGKRIMDCLDERDVAAFDRIAAKILEAFKE